jgi:hypothetical protein
MKVTFSLEVRVVAAFKEPAWAYAGAGRTENAPVKTERPSEVPKMVDFTTEESGDELISAGCRGYDNSIPESSPDEVVLAS